jgi:ATP-binding cassette, subfamily B, bacterial PglK
MSFESTILAPISAVGDAIKVLDKRQKRAIFWVSACRVFLTVLDLAGLVLVGVVVSIVSGTKIYSSSLVGTFLGFLAKLGFPNGYAILAVLAILFFIIKGVLSLWLNYATASYLGKIESAVSTKLFSGILEGDARTTGSLTRNDVLYGLTHSTNVLFAQTLTIATSLCGEFALLLGISIYLAVTNLALFALLSMFFGLIGLALQLFIGPKALEIGVRTQQSYLSTQNTALGALENFRQIRIFGNPKFYVSRFGEARSVLSKQSAKNATLLSLPRYVTEIAVMLGVALLLLLRSNDSVVSVSAPTIAVFLVGIFRIVASMLPIQAGLTSLSKNRPEANLAYNLLERTKLDDESTGTQRAAIELAVEFRKVSFGYSVADGMVIRGLDFQLSPGEFAAVVGKSGEGKSTFADLLLGLWHPNEGEVSIFGQNIKAFLFENPGAVGYVPQRVNLFEGTLRENLLLGRDQSEMLVDSQLEKCLKDLDLGGFLASLSLGLDTPLGESGIELSGGQVQRLGLARALIGNPRILVLDESTSALDEETTKIVTSVIESLKGKISIVAIAHRPETIRSADHVYELKNGRFREIRAKNA